MSTHTRAKTSRQQRHPASRGKSHKQDKRAAERRNGAAFVRVPAPARASPARPFEGYGITGHEFTHTAGNWHRCTGPEEFADYLETEAKRRAWFIDTTQRKGRAVKMKRKAATPVEVLTTTFPPWLSDWALAELQAGRDPRPQLADIRNAWAERALARLDGQRHVLGLAFHADTDDPHFDICTSRQDGQGGRIGEAGLRLVGPWCVGTDRQIRAGAQIAPKKETQLARSVANFRHRYGAESVPLDIELARDLDEAAAGVIGPALEPFRTAYAARVPEIEQANEAAALAALEAARALLLGEPEHTAEQQAEPEPAAEPELPSPELPQPTRRRPLSL